ncbi:MAG: phosphoribosylamine--glycine ligase [Alicyclobacillus sp.]|nr:phosphoribosylamine--glycine ligase [Alicyclobacillus sp.]
MNELQIPQRPRVLVLGSGAREHALVWKLAQSPRRPQLFVAPGNPGMETLAERVALTVEDASGVRAWAATHGIDLVVIGPEAALAAGVADALRQAGIRVFGPDRAAARLETSKAFAKQVMQAAGVPTAPFRVFDDAAAAADYVRTHGAPVVVKADGLAAGKGVVVADSVDAALQALDEMMVQGRFGAAGRQVVLEEKLVGREASAMCFVDGTTVVPMLPARDYKRVGDGDRGPNTGGMGAFAPVPDAPPDLGTIVSERIVRPVLAELAKAGVVYRGVLYVGLMLTAEGPQVVEFNCRFGDPETQVVLPLLASDLLEVAWATAGGELAAVPVQWHEKTAVCVVLAAEGYPGAPRTGDPLLLPDPAQVAEGWLFHAGTGWRDGQLVTAGGRVLSAVATGWDVATARARAYRLANQVAFSGKLFRRDIAVL